MPLFLSFFPPRGSAQRTTSAGRTPHAPHATPHAPRPTALRCRGAGWVGQGIEDVFGGGLGGVNAVGYSEAVKGDPGQEEPGVPGQLAPDRLDALEMAEHVLRSEEHTSE